MRENRPSGSMSGMWKRDRHLSDAAPHLDSTSNCALVKGQFCALPGLEDFSSQRAETSNSSGAVSPLECGGVAPYPRTNGEATPLGGSICLTQCLRDVAAATAGFPTDPPMP
jgi:hypothetical protein